MKDMSLLCEASELPGRDMAMIEYRHYGFIRRIPHFNTYGTVSFTFWCTGKLVEKKMFDTWFDAMIPADNGLLAYPEDSSGTPIYEAQVQINQYDTLGKRSYRATLIDALPISVAPIAQSWQDDSIQRMQVVFAFKKWVPYAVTSASDNSVPNNYNNDLSN